MFFACIKENKLNNSIKISISDNCEKLVEQMKEDYYDVQKYDKKNKIKHQFSHSQFKWKNESYAIIFYPDQSNITWEIRTYEIYNSDFSMIVEEIVKDSINRASSSYRINHIIDIESVNDKELTALVNIRL